MFDFEHMVKLPEMVKGLLDAPEGMQQIADIGFEKAEKCHIRKTRAWNGKGIY